MKNNVQNVAWAESVRREVFKNTETIIRNNGLDGGQSMNIAHTVSLGVMNTLLMSMIACEIAVNGVDNGEEVKSTDEAYFCGIRSDFDVKVGDKVIYARGDKRLFSFFPVGTIVEVKRIGEVEFSISYEETIINMPRGTFFDIFDPIASDDEPSIWISPVDGHPHAVVDGWIYSCGYMPVSGNIMIAVREYKKGHSEPKSLHKCVKAECVDWFHLSRFKFA